MDEFVYWAHPTAVGIRVEEVSGGDGYSPKAWLPMAKQIFAENGKDGYREVIHTDSGAPLLEGSAQRISVSHATGLLVVAMLPPVPGTDPESFSLRTALGVDVEKKDRKQVVRIRDKFLSDRELRMIPADDIEKNILAWTVKEAVFKALLSEGVDFRRDIRIERLPEIAEFPLDKKRTGRVLATRTGSLDNTESSADSDNIVNHGTSVNSSDSENSGNSEKNTFKEQAGQKEIVLDLFSYRSDDHIVTLAYSKLRN